MLTRDVSYCSFRAAVWGICPWHMRNLLSHAVHPQSKAAQCLSEEDLSKIELALRELAVPGPAAAAGLDTDDLWVNYDGFTQVKQQMQLTAAVLASELASAFAQCDAALPDESSVTMMT